MSSRFWLGLRSMDGGQGLGDEEALTLAGVRSLSVRMQNTPFSMYDAEWLVESWDGDRIKEKLAYCNSFACAQAAYDAAVISLPYDRITFRQRTRLIREHVGKWTPDAEKSRQPR